MTLRRMEIDANGLTFAAAADGQSKGPLVLLLHGFPQTGAMWAPTLQRLARLGYRAVAPDQRGYSVGANPPSAADYSADHLVGDVVAIADSLGARRFHVVGHDWGGAVAWAVAAHEPGRVLSVTSVSTPHPDALGRALRHLPQRLKSGYIPIFQLPRGPEAVLGAGRGLPLAAMAMATGLPRDRALADAAAITRVGLRGPLNWYRALRLQRPSPMSLGQVTVPALFVWGRRDPALGREAAEATAGFVSGRYTFVELNAGHWIPDRNRALLHRHLEAHLGAS